MDAIGLRLVVKKDKQPEITKMARRGQIPSPTGLDSRLPGRGTSCSFYGPNAGQANTSRFNLPEFNRLFEEARRLPDSAERTQLFNQMAELVVAYVPWRITVSPITDTLAHRRVRFFVPHPMRFPGGFPHINLDESLRAKAK
jgi:ABC-type transport system substrate-binding protein